MVSISVYGCSCDQPSLEKSQPSSERSQLDLDLTIAALNTVIQFNKSGLLISSPEIPDMFWAVKIKNLKPQKVYWHNNNLALVLNDSSSEENGIYICVPISSYLHHSDIIQLTFEQKSYKFKVKECLAINPPNAKSVGDF